MPKKHHPTYLHIKPTPPPSSSSAHSHTHSSNPSSQAPTQTSVTNLLTHLRRVQTPRATPHQINAVTQTLSTRTVPPHLRRLLQIPEVDAPLPKAGARQRRVRGEERGPPGPKAPGSWLVGSGRKRKGDGVRLRGGGKVCRFCRLAEVYDAEFKRLPKPRSLVHYALRAFAMNWEEVATYERYYLATIPTYLKEALLSYLGVHGQTGYLEYKAFKSLFGSEGEGQDAGLDEVRFLDLTGLLSGAFTLRDLEKCLRPLGASAYDTSSPDKLSQTEAEAKAEHTMAIADSWEDEPDDTTPLLSTLPDPFFPNLTRLSLAHPGPGASWTDLLALSPHLATLTHLSLAYWPRPSTTPNAATTDMVGQHTRVALGGSHLYSDLDDDWHEAANILRRLSLNTYCLTYLDLEGCTWLKALAWDMPTTRPGAPTSPWMDSDGDADEWTATPAAGPGPDWNGAWGRVERIHVFQGWVPADRPSLQGMPAGVVAVSLLQWLRDKEKTKGREGILDKTRKGWEVEEWVEREKVAQRVVHKVRTARSKAGGLWLKAEYGWCEDVRD